jgi:hypothetical protein
VTDRVLSDPAPASVGSTPAQTSISTTAALVLAANPKRKGLIVQNTGTTVIKLTLHATQVPTQTVYDVALGAGTGADDGTGGAYVDDAWVGNVFAISSGVGGTFVVKEFMTGNADWDSALYPGVR